MKLGIVFNRCTDTYSLKIVLEEREIERRLGSNACPVIPSKIDFRLDFFTAHKLSPL